MGVLSLPRVMMSRKEMKYESRLDCEGLSVNNMSENMMHEVVALEEENSSNLKITYPVEPNYRFGNQKKAGSYLLISRKDYQRLANENRLIMLIPIQDP